MSGRIGAEWNRWIKGTQRVHRFIGRERHMTTEKRAELSVIIWPYLGPSTASARPLAKST